MSKDNYFNDFRDICFGVLSQSGNCQESQDAFAATHSVPELVTAWKKYWKGIVTEVPRQTADAFAKFYATYRNDINRAGVYYNEAPPQTEQRATIIVGYADEKKKELSLSGRHRIYVLGDMRVMAYGHCSVYVCDLAEANVVVNDHCRCSCENGHIEARGRSWVNGKGRIRCYNSTTIYCTGGVVTDYGHLAISAYNDVMVMSPTTRYISLYDKATLQQREEGGRL